MQIQQREYLLRLYITIATTTATNISTTVTPTVAAIIIVCLVPAAEFASVLLSSGINNIVKSKGTCNPRSAVQNSRRYITSYQFQIKKFQLQTIKLLVLSLKSNTCWHLSLSSRKKIIIFSIIHGLSLRRAQH